MCTVISCSASKVNNSEAVTDDQILKLGEAVLSKTVRCVSISVCPSVSYG